MYMDNRHGRGAAIPSMELANLMNEIWSRPSPEALT